MLQTLGIVGTSAALLSAWVKGGVEGRGHTCPPRRGCGKDSQRRDVSEVPQSRDGVGRAGLGRLTGALEVVLGERAKIFWGTEKRVPVQEQHEQRH